MITFKRSLELKNYLYHKVPNVVLSYDKICHSIDGIEATIKLFNSSIKEFIFNESEMKIEIILNNINESLLIDYNEFKIGVKINELGNIL